MLSATLAMTPIYPLGLTGRDKTDRTAQTATFKLLGRAAHALSLAKLGRASARDPPRTLAAQAQTHASPGPGSGHTGVRPGSDPRPAPT